MLSRKRKIFIILIIFLLVITPCQAFSGFAPDEGVYIIEEVSGKEVFSQNKDNRFSPASTTKLMTALLLIENISDLNEPVICGNEVLDYDWRDSEAGYWVGQQTNYNELLYALLLPSGNDAAGVIAVNVGKKLLNDPNVDYHIAQEAFVNAMNQKAKDLGMLSTNFTNPAGREDPNHYTTPSDFAKVVNEAYKNDTIVNVSRTLVYPITSIKGFTYNLYNTDVLLYPTVRDLGMEVDPNIPPEQQEQILNQPSGFFSPFLKAGKTGTTENDMRTFVFSSDQGDARLIGVLFNFPTEVIFSEAKNILEELNNNYSMEIINESFESEIPVGNTFLFGDKELKIQAIEPLQNYKHNDQESNIEYNIRWNNNYLKEDENGLELIRDLDSGDKIGSLLVSSDGQILKTIPLYVQNNLQVGRLNTLLVYSIGLLGVIFLIQFILIKLKIGKTFQTNKREVLPVKN